MKTIWKYPIPIADLFALTMPLNSEPLCVQVQHGQPCLWALVEPTGNTTTETLYFRLAGTGHDIAQEVSKDAYLGTFQMNGGALVFHVFQLS